MNRAQPRADQRQGCGEYHAVGNELVVIRFAMTGSVVSVAFYDSRRRRRGERTEPGLTRVDSGPIVAFMSRQANLRLPCSTRCWVPRSWETISAVRVPVPLGGAAGQGKRRPVTRRELVSEISVAFCLSGAST